MSQELEGTLTNSANLTGTFGSEGGGGTSNYNDLINKPSINSVTLQGNKTASQLGFANVATSGSYDDLTNKPSIPAAQVNSDWNATSGVAEILNKPTIYQNAAELPVSSSDPTDTKTYIDTGLSGKTQVKVAKETLTTNASGFVQINVTPKNIIVLSAWSSTGDVLIIPFSASNASEYGTSLWWFRVHNASMQVRTNFTFDMYYSYIET